MSMTYFLWILISSISLIFTRIIHPLAMGATLLIQTILICAASSLSMKITWFSYILFLIFLGAMLVLFIYVASLAPNESFSLSWGSTGLVLLTLAMGSILLLTDPLTLPLTASPEKSLISADQAPTTSSVVLSTFFNPPSVNLTVFIIMYLLLTLIVVVKITSEHFGPLRLG